MSTLRSSSAWDRQQITEFLQAERIPVRLACPDTAGVPLICSLWYQYADDAVWCATQQSAYVLSLLKRSPHVGFEIAPESMPYRGVRGQGQVSLLPEQGQAVLLQLMDRYLDTGDTKFAAWLKSRAATEVAIRIEPDWLTSWDFGARMNA